MPPLLHNFIFALGLKLDSKCSVPKGSHIQTNSDDGDTIQIPGDVIANESLERLRIEAIKIINDLFDAYTKDLNG